MPHPPQYYQIYGSAFIIDSMGADFTFRPPIMFGGYPDDVDYMRWRSEFDAEMYRCRRGNYGEKGSSLDILHISTDLEAASGEMKKIIGFLKLRSFAIQRVHKPKYWTEADLLIIGGDEPHSKYAANLTNYLPSVLGIVTPLDVLLYGLHGKIETNLAPVDRPFLTDRYFGLDGVCLVHSRMRRWTDSIVFGGIFNNKVIGIENCIDAVLGWKDKWFTTKVKNFKKKLKDKGRYDSEAELFFAAVDVANACRNVGAHAQKHVPKNKSFDYTAEKLQEFNKVAAKHKRTELYLGYVSNNFAGMTESTKHYIRLATYAHNWAIEYVKLYGQN